MSRRPSLSPDQIKDAADRAEGIKPPESEAVLGRPPSYRPEFAGQAEKLCALGATNADLADFFGVNIRTVERWIVERDDFCRAVKDAKAALDERVVRSLYQRAVGYTFDSEKVFQNKGEIVRAKVREHCPPDTTAAIFWLKNRQPDLWREKSEVRVERAIEDMTDEQLLAEIERARDHVGVRSGAAGGSGSAPARHH